MATNQLNDFATKNLSVALIQLQMCIKRVRHLTLKRSIFSVVGVLVTIMACPAVALAASETGDIAVLKFALNNNVNIATLDKCEKEKKTEKRPEFPGTLNGWDGASSYSGNITLKCRGNSSAYWHPKKGYSLELKKNFYFGSAGNFLGMPANKEWVLHSCWADKTCLRNVIGYWLAGNLFPWAPRTEFAEVYINGDYRGLYVVTEKIEIAPDRVDLPQPNNDPLAGITGAYILQEQGNDPDPDWRTFYSRQPWWLVSPKKEEISPAQQRYIQDFMDIEVDAKFTPGSHSPPYEPWKYDKVMDEQSAVDFVIIQEIANNPDGYWKSLHVTKYPISIDGPIWDLVHMGPIWDLDLSFGNYAELWNTGILNYDPNDPKQKEVNAVCETNRWRIEKSIPKFGPLWGMWSVPQFRRAIYNRWWSLRSDATISRRRIVGNADHTGAIVKFDHTGLIDKFAARIADARARDDSRWHTLGTRTFLECWNETTYEEEVNHLKSWIYERITWIDQKLINVFW